MSVLIIGGSGFVESSLVSELDNIECENLDKNKSLFYPKITTTGNITNLNEINFKRF